MIENLPYVNIELALWSTLAVALVGLVIKWFYRDHYEKEVTWGEFLLVTFVVAPIVAIGVSRVGLETARQNALWHHEFWNGWELLTTSSDYACQRDGSCRNTYACDHYTYQYQCGCMVHNEDGFCIVPSYCTGSAHHSCPWTKTEWNYGVSTTLDDYVFVTHALPLDFNSQLWRPSQGQVPLSVQVQAGVGPNQAWINVEDRILRGSPGPVTKIMEYEDYILASQSDAVVQYADVISGYLAAGLMPEPVKEIHNHYHADKVRFISKVDKDIYEAWQSQLAYFNAGLGTELQGDLYIVVVPYSVVPSSASGIYLAALKAYWQDTTTHGKDILGKNGIIVVLGIDAEATTVMWAVADTAMPVGNTLMKSAVRFHLDAIPFDPVSVIGTVRGQFDVVDGVRKVRTIVESDGELTQIIWGLRDRATKFQRICMVCDDPGDVGVSQRELFNEIQPSGTAKFWIVLAVVVLSLVFWFAAVQINTTRKQRRYPY